MIFDKLKAKFKKPNPHLSDNIKEIGLSFKTYHCLRRAGIATVGDLTELSWNDLKTMRRMTRNTIEEVEMLLKGIGLKLREEQE